MNKQQQSQPQADRELKLYWIGLIVLATLWVFTFVLASFTTELKLLQLRLTLNGLGIVYFLSVHLYHHRLAKRTSQHMEINQNDIIIWFNGRELERK